MPTPRLIRARFLLPILVPISGLTGCAGMTVWVNGEPRVIGAKNEADGGGAGQGPSAADPVRVASDFSPNPLVVEAPVGSESFGPGLGTRFPECNIYTGETSQEPVLSFTLTEATDDLEIRHHPDSEVGYGVLQTPDGRSACWGDTLDLGEWPAGTYTFHPYAEYTKGVDGMAMIVLTSPRRAAASAGERFAQTLRADKAANPAVDRVTPGPGAAPLAKHLGLESCVHKNVGDRYVVTPVAALEIEKASRYNIRLRGVSEAAPPPPPPSDDLLAERKAAARAKRQSSDKGYLILEDERGQCTQLASRTNGPMHDQSIAELQPGRYRLWVGLEPTAHIPESYDVALFDVEAPVTVPKRPTVTISDKSKGAIAQSTGGREGMRGGPLCGDGAPDPDFFIDSTTKEPLRPYPLFSRDDGVTYSIYGPLEGQFDGKARCRDSTAGEGTFAVWVNAKEGSRVVSQVGSVHKHGRTQLNEVPKGLALADREYGLYFPFYGDTEASAAETLFAIAPADLFVFSTTTSNGVRPSEPLLLADYGAKESKVLTLTGTVRTVRTQNLETKPSGALVLPPLPEVEAPTDSPDSYWPRYANYTPRSGYGPDEQELMRTYHQKGHDIEGCIHRYRKKHDPTYNKRYDLVDLRTGQSIGDRTYKAAARKCGKNVQKSGKALKAKLLRARKKARNEMLESLRKKFPG